MEFITSYGQGILTLLADLSVFSDTVSSVRLEITDGSFS
jgi:hypothetical protein